MFDYRSWLFLPLYRFKFYIYVYIYTFGLGTRIPPFFLCPFYLPRGVILYSFSFPFISMAASGNGNEPTVADAVGSREESNGLSVAQTPFQVDSIAEMQRQIKANHALVLFLREELHQYNVARSATSTHGHRSPSSDSLREPVGEPLLPGASPVPEDSIPLFAQGSSIQETGARGVSVRYPSSIDLDVEPYLSRPKSTPTRQGSRRISPMFQTYCSYLSGRRIPQAFTI